MAEMIEYINKLTVTERLQVMESLWNSLCVPEYESPAWHEGVLKEREHRVAEGQAEFMSLEESKSLLTPKVLARSSPPPSMLRWSPFSCMQGSILFVLVSKMHINTKYLHLICTSI